MAAISKRVDDKKFQENSEHLNDDSNKQLDSYTLAVLRIIKDAQQQHGLRHDDYQRYRQYCARRIHRIRKSIHFPQGTRHKVQPHKPTKENLTDIKFLYLPLVDAERCWSYAMQLKAEANTERRKRYHMITRLKKAVQWAELFLTLCHSDKCDARTKLEAQAYHGWMKASLLFELEQWLPAKELYTQAKTIYEKLGGMLADEFRDVYLQKCDEIAPNIRYCSYNIGDKTAIKDLMQMRMEHSGLDAMSSNLDELIEKTREKQSATMSEVTWRGRTVPVRNDHVRMALLNVQESEKQITDMKSLDSKLSVYERLLKELIDAQQTLKEEHSEIFKSVARGSGQQGDEKVPNVVYLLTYLTYLRLMKTVERNLTMMESLRANVTPAQGVDEKKNSEKKKPVKPQDFARLYDIIIQNLSEIPSLPGLVENESIGEEIYFQLQYYKTFRCYYTAQTYASAKKWHEAIALYDRVLQYAEDARQRVAKNKKKFESVWKLQDMSALEDVIRDVEGQRCTCHASSILDDDIDSITDHVAATSLKDQKPLMERLDEYVEDPSIATANPKLTRFPPEFEPIPCKPLFFDVALSLMEFPNLDDKMEQKKQGGGGGIGNFVKGWLWGGGKK